MDKKLVDIKNDRAVTTSLIVAQVFEKQHFNVVRDICNLIAAVNEVEKGVFKIGETPMFQESTYIHEQNHQEYPMYHMNRDGFSLLVMGFTGQKALKFKLEFINEFNRMESIIRDVVKSKADLLKHYAEEKAAIEFKVEKLNLALASLNVISQGLQTICGCERGMAIAHSAKVVEDLYKVELPNIKALLPAATKEIGTMNASQLGLRLGYTGQAMNRELQRKGYQYKDAKAQWHLTEKGREFAEAVPYSRNGHSAYQIRWRESIVDELKNKIIARR